MFTLTQYRVEVDLHEPTILTRLDAIRTETERLTRHRGVTAAQLVTPVQEPTTQVVIEITTEGGKERAKGLVYFTLQDLIGDALIAGVDAQVQR